MSHTSGREYQGNEFATAWRPGIGSQEDLTAPGSQLGIATSLRGELASAANHRS